MDNLKVGKRIKRSVEVSIFKEVNAYIKLVPQASGKVLLLVVYGEMFDTGCYFVNKNEALKVGKYLIKWGSEHGTRNNAVRKDRQVQGHNKATRKG